MRKVLFAMFVLAGAAAAAGCGQSQGQTGVPQNPVARENAGNTVTTSGPRGKVVVQPGPVGTPDMKAKQIP
jgi:hypothetical protein